MSRNSCLYVLPAAALLWVCAARGQSLTGIVYVSDLTWKSMTNGWGPAERDRSNGEKAAGDGRTLTLNGTPYSKGLGVHAVSDIRYAIAGSCTGFTAQVGVDDEVGTKGSVVFEVWGDGTRRYASGVMKGTTATQAVNVNVSGVQELRLAVTNGGDNNASDHADWADAKLSCGPATPPPTTTTYLSDRTPTYSANGWGPVERDRSNGENGAGDGRTITLNGVPFAKGLGVHAVSDVRYSLGGACTTFTASVGVDDEVGTGGSVTFEVWADGAKLFDSGLMTGTTATKAASVNVSGKNELKLVVTNGGDNINNDHGDWAEARVTCASSGPGPSPVNQAPTVSAGPQQTITLPATATLVGTAMDDGLPNGTLTLAWSAVSGPGAVVFSAPSSATTTASFAAAGSYVVRLSASDAALTATSDTTVMVQASSGVPAGAIAINPGDDIQAAVDRNATGATFYLRAGVHRLQTIVPKDGQTFLGEAGAVLNGSRLLTSFTREGSYWVATGQTQAGPVSGQCDATHPRCIYPEDLYFDDQPLLHVARLADVKPGAWFFDYAKDTIYFADDPNGHKVETSVNTYAFYGSASRVTIRGLIIEKYASRAQGGAIHGKTEPFPHSNYWVIENNEFRLNHGGAIRTGNYMRVANNNIHHNGQIGIVGGGPDLLIEGNEIAFNCILGFDYQWEGGGTKFVQTEGLTVRNNYVHDNIGPGLWTDADNYRSLYEGNRVVGNVTGIFHEISYDAVIRNNIVESNGLKQPSGQTSLWYTAGILVASSQNVEVYGNTLANNRNGIGASQYNRGTGQRGPYETRNLNVHDNTIVQNGGLAAGMIDSGYGSVVYTSWNNHFQGDDYTLGSLSGLYFAWMGTDVNAAQWRNYGNDTTGTFK